MLSIRVFFVIIEPILERPNTGEVARLGHFRSAVISYQNDTREEASPHTEAPSSTATPPHVTGLYDSAQVSSMIAEADEHHHKETSDQRNRRVQGK